MTKTGWPGSGRSLSPWVRVDPSTVTGQAQCLNGEPEESVLMLTVLGKMVCGKKGYCGKDG